MDGRSNIPWGGINRLRFTMLFRAAPTGDGIEFSILLGEDNDAYPPRFPAAIDPESNFYRTYVRARR